MLFVFAIENRLLNKVSSPIMSKNTSELSTASLNHGRNLKNTLYLLLIAAYDCFGFVPNCSTDQMI